MKAALVIPGGPKVPQLDKARRYGVTRIYWVADDPQLDSALIESVRAQGFSVGIMRDPHGMDTQAFAQLLSDDLTRLGCTARQCAVIADIEAHDPNYVETFLFFWRLRRPTRETAWTMEPFQGGWFSPALKNRIAADPNLKVIPQLYYGNMAPAVESLVALDIAAQGISTSRIECFYGLNNNLKAWYGILYDLINLP